MARVSISSFIMRYGLSAREAHYPIFGGKDRERFRDLKILELPRSGFGAATREAREGLGRVSEFCQKCRHGVGPERATRSARASGPLVKQNLRFFNGKRGGAGEKAEAGAARIGAKGSESDQRGRGSHPRAPRGCERSRSNQARLNSDRRATEAAVRGRRGHATERKRSNRRH